jgi:hypothetical protein
MHYTGEAPPQTDKHVDLWCFAAEFRLSVAQGKDTYGFLPLHPFLPSLGHLCLPAPLACMRWQV